MNFQLISCKIRQSFINKKYIPLKDFFCAKHVIGPLYLSQIQIESDITFYIESEMDIHRMLFADLRNRFRKISKLLDLSFIHIFKKTYIPSNTNIKGLI